MRGGWERKGWGWGGLRTRERQAEEKMVSAASLLQQTGCILSPSWRRPTDHCESEDRSLHSQTSHVHQALSWPRGG